MCWKEPCRSEVKGSKVSAVRASVLKGRLEVDFGGPVMSKAAEKWGEKILSQSLVNVTSYTTLGVRG